MLLRRKAGAPNADAIRVRLASRRKEPTFAVKHALGKLCLQCWKDHGWSGEVRLPNGFVELAAMHLKLSGKPVPNSLKHAIRNAARLVRSGAGSASEPGHRKRKHGLQGRPLGMPRVRVGFEGHRCSSGRRGHARAEAGRW